MQHGEHEPEIDGDGRLARQERLDPLLERQVARIHLVVEADHLVRELRIAPPKRVDRPAKRSQDELSLLEQPRLEGVEILLERDPHPKRPVT